MIHILDHKTDSLLGDSTSYYDDNHSESLQNNKELFHFTEPSNSKISPYLSKKNRVIIPVDDGFFREFIINEARQIKNGIIVYTQASFIELKNEEPIAPIVLQGQTINTAMDFMLNGTGWQRGITEYAGTRTIEIEEYIDPYSGLKLTTNTSNFDLELRFRIETKGGKVVARYVDAIKKQGAWRGKEIVSGKDLINAERIENTGNVVTALYGIGPIKEDGSREVVIVKNEEARQVWGRNGKHLWDIYIPQTDDMDMTKERLTTLTEMELNKRISAHVSYIVEGVDIEHVMGREHEKVRLGDSVRIKATDYNPPIYLESRVIAREGPIRNKSKKKYTLGEFIEYTEDDIKASLKILEKQIAKNISEAQLLQYAEPIIPEQPTAPDPSEHPKWVDTSGDIPQLKLFDGAKWTAVKGEDGADGKDGSDGEDGESSYSFIAYANSPDGTVDFSTTESEDKDYIGTFTHTQSGKVNRAIGPVERGYNLGTGLVTNNSYRTFKTAKLPKGIYTIYHETDMGVRIEPSSNRTILEGGGTYNFINPFKIEVTEESEFQISMRRADTSDLGEEYETLEDMKLQLVKGTNAYDWSPALEDLAQDPANYNWQRTKGNKGTDGKGITSTSVDYQNHTNGTTAPTGVWNITIPTPVKGRYLWTRTITDYTDNSSVTTYSVSYYATDGQKGDDGKGITNTEIRYQISTSGTNVPTGTWLANIPTPIKGQYLWTRTVISYTDDTSSTSYSTSYYATDGQKGEQGEPGPAGKDGIAHMGTSPPSNPAINGTWFETDSTGRVIAIKKWTGNEWEMAEMTEDVLTVGKLSAITANLGNVTAGDITGVTITSSQFIHEYVDIYGKRYNARFEYGGLYLTEILSNGLESPLVTSFQKDRMNMAENFTIYNGGNVFEVQAIDLKFKKSGAGIDEPSRSVLVDQEDGWHTVTSPTSTGWTNVSGYGPMRYALNKIGEVMLSGFISGSGISNINIFTLPTGFRPNTNRVFPGYTSSGKVIRLEITSAGLVRALNYVAGDGFLSLDNVRFNRF